MRRVIVGLILCLPFCLATTLAQGQSLEEKFDALKQEFDAYKEQQAEKESKSPFSNMSIKFGGRLFNDWAWFDLDSDLETAFPSTQDGTEFRAARLFVSGTLHENVDFKVQYDFAGQDVDMKDVWMGLKGLPCGIKLRVGHQKEPMGLERLTSSRFVTFMERSSATVLTPGRNTGVQALGNCGDGMFTWAAGFFRATDDSGDVSDNGKLNFTARGTVCPIYEDDGAKVLHFGGSYSRRNPNDSGLQFDIEPEIHIADEFVDTGLIDVDNVDLYNVEAALVCESLSLQGEAMFASAELGDGTDTDFSGFYGQVSYFLTGERRNYSRSKAAFGRVKPKQNIMDGEGGFGAVELAGRYSFLDLEDGPVTGGELEGLTFGVNWYLNPNTRVMANYNMVDVDDLGDGTAFQMRFQIDF